MCKQAMTYQNGDWVSVIEEQPETFMVTVCVKNKTHSRTMHGHCMKVLGDVRAWMRTLQG